MFNLHDTAELGLFGAFGLTTFTIDTVTYVAVSAITDDALSPHTRRAFSDAVTDLVVAGRGRRHTPREETA